MSVDVSTLQIKVVSDGIQAASKQIGGLSTAANNAEKRVDKLTATINKLIGVQNTATAAATGFNAALSNTTTATTGSSTATSKLLAAVDKLNAGMLKLVDKANDANVYLKKMSEGMNSSAGATEKSTTAIRKNTQAMADAHGMARGLTGSMGALWLTYGNFATVAMGAAIGASFMQVIKVGKDVEHTLEGIRVRGAESYESVDKLRASLMELGKGVYGPQEVADAFNNLIMAGLKADQAAVAIKDALNLAVVGGTSVEKSAYTLVQVGTALGYTAEGYGRVADVIAKTAAVSMSSVESLSESFKSASAVGKLYGASIEDIGVALAALSNLGISGSAAGTSLKNFYKELSVESNKLKATLKDMHMVPADLQDANGKFLDMITVVSKLSEGLDKLNPAQQAQAIQKMSNERGMKTIVELLDLFRKKTEEGSTALQDMRKQIADSYAYAAFGAAQLALTADSQFKSVKNTLLTNFAGAFREIQPQMLVFASQLRNIFDSDGFKKGIQDIAITLANLAVAFAENIDKIKYFVAGLVALKTLSIVAGAIQSVTVVLGGLATAFTAAGFAAKGFQLSLGILGAALLAAGAAWAWYNSQKSGQTAQEQAAKTTLEEMNKGLDAEIDRIKKVNAQLALGVDIKKADAQATRDQMVAMAYKKRDEIKDSAGKELNATLADIEARKAVIPKGAWGANAELAKLTTEATKAQEKYNTKVHEARLDVADTVIKTQELANESKKQAEWQEANIKKQREAATAGAGGGVLSGKEDKSGIAKVNAELERHRNALVDINAAYDVQVKLLASMKALGPDYEKATPGMRKVAEIESELAAINERAVKGAALRTDAIMKLNLTEELSAAKVLRAKELEVLAQKKINDQLAEVQTRRDSDIRQLSEEVLRWEAKAAAIGGAKEATAEYTLARMEDQRNAAIALNGSVAEIEYLTKMIDLQKKLVEAKRTVGQADAAKAAMDSFNKLFDSGRALEFGHDFETAFGKVGKSIDQAAKGFDKFLRRQKDVDKAREDLAKDTSIDAKQRLKMSDAITDRETRNNIDMYADMTSAAKSFFDEKTTGYKTMDAIEKGLRAVQLSMAIKEAAIKLGLINSVTAATVVGDQTKTQSAVQSAGAQIGASQAVAGAKATEGVINQASGDPYTAFARMAAMAAVMAALGFAVSGGGGSSAADLSKSRQETQGTGTVLGNESGKSESVSHALDAIKENTTLGLEHSGRMLMALRSIDNGIKSMAVAVAGTAGLRGTAADQKAAGVGSSSSFLGFSKSSTTLLDSGLTFNQARLADLMQGGSIGVSGYQDIQRQKSSFFGLSKSSSTSRELSGVDSDLQRQIDLTIRNLASGTLAAATALGQTSGIVENRLKEFVVDIGDISLKGLSGDDIEKELAAAFGKLGDQMANAVMPGFREFQRLGEGGFDTLVRLANGVEVAKKELDNLGVSMIAYQDIVNKQGDVDVELIRQSIALKEAGSNIADMMNVMDGSAQDLIDTYKKLTDLRGSLRAMGLANDVSNAMLRGAESLDALLSNMGSFMDGFYTDAEKQAIKVSKLREQFAALGVAMPSTAADFRSLVENLMRGGERTQDLAARVLALSDAFLEVSDAAKEAHDAAISTARDDLSEAYDRESEALKDTIDKMKDFVNSLKEFKESLIMGDQSPLSTTEKYATALAKYNETYQKAMGGDAKSIEEFQNVAQQLLQFSREMYASGDQYTSDFTNVLKNIDEVMGVAGSQVDMATQQLDALKESVKTLIDIDTTVKTVAEILVKLQSLMGGTATIDGSHANGLSSVPFDGYIAELHKGERVLTAEENKAYGVDYSRYSSNSNDALVAEIKALRAEVVSLKESNANDANRIIGANYDAQERNAQNVVDGVKSTAQDAAYIARTQPSLN